jgi:hypothetical protein
VFVVETRGQCEERLHPLPAVSLAMNSCGEAGCKNANKSWAMHARWSQKQV